VGKNVGINVEETVGVNDGSMVGDLVGYFVPAVGKREGSYVGEDGKSVDGRIEVVWKDILFLMTELC
jgi:dynactin complex subunit